MSLTVSQLRIQAVFDQFLPQPAEPFTQAGQNVCLSVCLYVNQGHTNHNCCIQGLVTLHAQTY